jgi:hypothetical protein
MSTRKQVLTLLLRKGIMRHYCSDKPVDQHITNKRNNFETDFPSPQM